MAVEVVVALIAAGVALIGSITTLIVGLRTIRIEREKLQVDRERMKVEVERLQSETIKLGAETEKLRAEIDETRRQKLEIANANLELEKHKALALMDQRTAIYPEMLELVYRLKNSMRDNVWMCKQDFSEEDLALLKMPTLGQELYLLTENLYKYRAFIDKETFDMVHRYKRLLQDAQVQFDRISRSATPPKNRFEEFRTRAQESIEVLDEIYSEVEELYPKITTKVQDHVETVLKRE